MNPIKINLKNLIPKKSRIILNKKFRINLFNQLFKIYSKSELARKFWGDRRNYYDWSIGRRNPPFWLILEFCKILKINEKKLLLNTSYITSKHEQGSIKIKDFDLAFDSQMAEWFGLVKGDGCISKKYIDCGNTKLPIVLQFAEFLEEKLGITKSQFEATLRLPLEGMKEDFKNIILSIRQKGYNKIIIAKRNERLKRRMPLFIIRLNSRLLADIMTNIQDELYYLLDNSSDDVKSAFIRGYCAAEGSVGDRRITISQNNFKELKFIKNLLISLGFEHVCDPEKLRRCYRICIYTKKELEKFYKEIGFGRHELRNQKLKELIDSYNPDYREFKSKKQRYREFLDIIGNYGRVTAPFITTKTDIIYKCTSRILKNMVEDGIIGIDNNSKPYFYYLNDAHENQKNTV